MERSSSWGGIFDLWRARPERAMRDSRYLFERLSDLDVKIKLCRRKS